MGSSGTGDEPEPALLQRIIAYLDDPEDSALIWRGLHFMEANGIDFALRYGELHAYLTDPHYSPLNEPEQLTHAEEREIVLALRDIVRNDLGLPPLSPDQKASWAYDIWEPVSWRPDQLTSKVWGETYHPSAEEVAELERQLDQAEPELMRALRLLLSHNTEVDDDPARRQSIMWTLSRLEKAIAKLNSDYEASAIQNLKNGILKGLRQGKKTK